MLGDVKKDADILKGATTGTYFGVRGAVRSISSILGLPVPIGIFISDVSASIVAEATKLAGRNSNDKEILNLLIEEKNALFPSLDINSSTFVKSIDNNYENTDGFMEFEEVNASTPSNTTFFSISLPEIIQDVTKWVAYDLLIPVDIPDPIPFMAAIQYGWISGIMGIVYNKSNI